MSSETLSFPSTWATSLEPYLPPLTSPPAQSTTIKQEHNDQPTPAIGPLPPTRPFTTLTYAQSLDSQLALAPGVRTLLSGPESKAMTHFIRSRHDAILVGVGTAVADDPGLNCRLESAGNLQHHPRPVVVDPGARWAVSEGSKVVQLAREGKGKGPWVLYAAAAAAGAEGAGTEVVVDKERRRVVESVGGRYIPVPMTRRTAKTDSSDATKRAGLAWESTLAVLREQGVESLMVEGGGRVINDLLELANNGVDIVDSVIVTIAPVWLGSGGVTVAPDRPVDGQGKGVPGPRLGDVRWVQMGEDMVLCGKVAR